MNLDELDLQEQSILPLILGSGHEDPYPVYEYLRTNYPVHRDASGTWLVSSHAFVTRILENREGLFYSRVTSKRPACLRDTILMQTDAHHTHQRKLFGPMFTKDALGSLETFMHQEIERLVTPLLQLPRFNLTNVALELAVRTVCKLLGIPQQQAATYLNASKGAAQLMGSLFLNDADRTRLEQEAEDFAEMLEALIDGVDENVEQPISHFVMMETNGDITRSGVVGNLLFFFITGYITTVLSIGNVLAQALRERSIWQSWCDDPDSISRGVRELMRYDPAAHAILRYARRDVELGGQCIPRGERIVLLLAAANRDPAEFQSPDSIDLNRSQERSLVFGAGAHACIGRVLSNMQIGALIGALAKCTPELSLDAENSRRTQKGRVHGYPALWLTRSPK
ncbi:Cytochrome P450 [Burkholderia sp. D7]|nr:Cytochrome P450 [Burkholderia sp. D7]